MCAPPPLWRCAFCFFLWREKEVHTERVSGKGARGKDGTADGRDAVEGAAAPNGERCAHRRLEVSVLAAGRRAAAGADPNAFRALNEQVKTLESWRKTALERERERERERALWSSSPRKGLRADTSVGGTKTASGEDEHQREASVHGARTGTRGLVRAGDERQNEYYYVAHAVRNNIRARVREELGQGKLARVTVRN